MLAGRRSPHSRGARQFTCGYQTLRAPSGSLSDPVLALSAESLAPIAGMGPDKRHGPEPARSESHGSSSCPRCPESITAGATHRGPIPATPRDVDLAHRVLGHAEKYAIVTHSPLPAVGAHSCPKSSPRRRVLAHSEVPSRSAIRSHLLRPTPGCRHRRCHGCPGRLSVGRRYLRPPHQQGPRPRHAWHVGALRHDLRRRRRQGQGCVRGSPVRRAHLPNLEDDQEAALRQVFSTE